MGEKKIIDTTTTTVTTIPSCECSSDIQELLLGRTNCAGHKCPHTPLISGRNTWNEYCQSTFASINYHAGDRRWWNVDTISSFKDWNCLVFGLKDSQLVTKKESLYREEPYTPMVRQLLVPGLWAHSSLPGPVLAEHVDGLTSSRNTSLWTKHSSTHRQNWLSCREANQ